MLSNVLTGARSGPLVPAPASGTQSPAAARMTHLEHKRHRWLQMGPSTRVLGDALIWQRQRRSKVREDGRGAGYLGALPPASEQELRTAMVPLDQLEEQVYGQLAWATSQGLPIEALGDRYDVALSRLVDLETSIAAMGEGEIAGWHANSVETQAYLQELLADLVEANRGSRASERAGGVLMGAAALGVAALAGWAVYRGSRARRGRR